MHALLSTLAGLVLFAAASPAGATPWELLPAGAVRARLTAESDLSRHRVMQPLSLAPDLVVGLRDTRAIAWHHSRAFDGRLGAGNGLCITGSRETLGRGRVACASRYGGSGLSYLQRVTRRTIARVGLLLADASPFTLATSGGAIMRAAAGRWWTTAAPSLVIGVTHRERGNRDRVQLPVYAGVTLRTGELHVRTGFDATLQTVADTFVVPVGLGASMAVGRAVRIGGDLTFDRAFGPLNAMSWRSSFVYAEVRLGGRS